MRWHASGFMSRIRTWVFSANSFGTICRIDSSNRVFKAPTSSTMSAMRILIVIVIVLAIVATAGFVAAGRGAGPVIQIVSPEKFVGISTPLDVVITAPAGKLAKLSIAFEQNGGSTPLVSEPPSSPSSNDAQGVHVTKAINRESVPSLKSGSARIVITVSRTALFGLRAIESTTSRDVTVRLDMPAVSVISTKHY